jgi:hypothetical protein
MIKHIQTAVDSIKSGIPFDVVIDSLLESHKEPSPEFWRMVLETLSSNVRKGNSWETSLNKTAKEWTGYGKDAPVLTTEQLLKFLKENKLEQKAKQGMSDEDITRIFSRLSGSEVELDAYWGEKKKHSSSTQSTERLKPAMRKETRRLSKDKKKKENDNKTK